MVPAARGRWTPRRVDTGWGRPARGARGQLRRSRGTQLGGGAAPRFIDQVTAPRRPSSGASGAGAGSSCEDRFGVVPFVQGQAGRPEFAAAAMVRLRGGIQGQVGVGISRASVREPAAEGGERLGGAGDPGAAEHRAAFLTIDFGGHPARLGRTSAGARGWAPLTLRRGPGRRRGRPGDAAPDRPGRGHRRRGGARCGSCPRSACPGRRAPRPSRRPAARRRGRGGRVGELARPAGGARPSRRRARRPRAGRPGRRSGSAARRARRGRRRAGRVRDLDVEVGLHPYRPEPVDAPAPRPDSGPGAAARPPAPGSHARLLVGRQARSSRCLRMPFSKACEVRGRTTLRSHSHMPGK